MSGLTIKIVVYAVLTALIIGTLTVINYLANTGQISLETLIFAIFTIIYAIFFGAILSKSKSKIIDIIIFLPLLAYLIASLLSRGDLEISTAVSNFGFPLVIMLLLLSFAYSWIKNRTSTKENITNKDKPLDGN